MDDLAGELREHRLELREEFRAMRTEMREGFQDLREGIRGLRSETKEEMRDLRGELYSTRRWTVNLWATTVLGFVALLIQTSLR
jgi:hypothetical protein